MDPTYSVTFGLKRWLHLSFLVNNDELAGTRKVAYVPTLVKGCDKEEGFAPAISES